MPTIVLIETPSLGDRSYLAHDGDVAFVVDPQRDLDRVLDLAEREGVRIAAVFDTHIHNDYVTGGIALARQVGADYYLNEADDVSFDRTPIRDGQVVQVGSMAVRAIATPGHTFTHLSYALEGDEPVVFTGGSLLFGSTGRPDLLGQEHSHELARHQHASAHRLATELPDEARVMPTHGFGSFCSATQSSGDSSTIGAEKRANPALTKDEADYVEDILAGLEEYPAYYAHMAAANSAGPDAADLSPVEKADASELRRRLEAGEWLVDLRQRTAFAAGHAPGTFNFGIDGQFSTYLGWLIPWGTPVTLLGDSQEQVDEAQREMTLIGIRWRSAAATGRAHALRDDALSWVPTAKFADLAQVRHHRAVSVLDVRRPAEFASGHIENAVNVPIHDLLTRADDVPGGEVWVHCAGGYRASVAASILAAAGKQVVAVDDDFDNVRGLGLPITG
ncbi:MAG: MBL fold metallo-hydrolase [Micrococcales bacterium]|nr:MBL fold metallo-hydrolase [Micrococcales bacterium]